LNKCKSGGLSARHYRAAARRLIHQSTAADSGDNLQIVTPSPLRFLRANPIAPVNVRRRSRKSR
ncbi:hypothetical protein EVAR_101057_1, partial [Eumeta japonica]